MFGEYCFGSARNFDVNSAYETMASPQRCTVPVMMTDDDSSSSSTEPNENNKIITIPETNNPSEIDNIDGLVPCPTEEEIVLDHVHIDYSEEEIVLSDHPHRGATDITVVANDVGVTGIITHNPTIIDNTITSSSITTSVAINNKDVCHPKAINQIQNQNQNQNPKETPVKNTEAVIPSKVENGKEEETIKKQTKTTNESNQRTTDDIHKQKGCCFIFQDLILSHIASRI